MLVSCDVLRPQRADEAERKQHYRIRVVGFSSGNVCRSGHFDGPQERGGPLVGLLMLREHGKSVIIRLANSLARLASTTTATDALTNSILRVG